ncbi:DUF6099 family protein [Kitasatospora sp. NBC_01287]|uniref:DUF6099 family protein n=1 Tax=Kitasatospora sp. NBC_01287 TaxID=2903573 RepID=UPI00224F049D|nr:DUF6099 family protein [Kitasatospora sp. NBC_01287]MCX4748973.1 DUF6099 family protein [Kitasatospora sp. NBC_01287]
MDALRLIKTTRHALAEARTVPDVLSEAWQTASLTAALAERLTGHPAAEVASVAQALARVGGHAAGLLEAVADPPEGGDWAAAGRAERLSRIGELGPVLSQLRLLLAEVAEALVAVAGSTDSVAQGAYWLAIDGLDASAECRSLVIELLRLLRRGVVGGPLAEPGADPAQVPPAGPPGRAAPHSAPASVRWSEGGRPGGPPSRVPGPANADPAEGAPTCSDPAVTEPGAESGPAAGAEPAEAVSAQPEEGPVEEGPVEEEPVDDQVRLVITLTPPPAGAYRAAGPPASAAPERSVARAPEASRSARNSSARPPGSETRAGPRSAPRSARSALSEASSSCIWSSRLLVASCCGATGASYLGSDMRGTLQFGGAA